MSVPVTDNNGYTYQFFDTNGSLVVTGSGYENNQATMTGVKKAVTKGDESGLRAGQCDSFTNESITSIVMSDRATWEGQKAFQYLKYLEEFVPGP